MTAQGRDDVHEGDHAREPTRMVSQIRVQKEAGQKNMSADFSRACSRGELQGSSTRISTEVLIAKPHSLLHVDDHDRALLLRDTHEPVAVH